MCKRMEHFNCFDFQAQSLKVKMKQNIFKTEGGKSLLF